MLRLILILSCAFLGVLSVTFGPKCKPDRECVTKHTADIYNSLFEDESNQLDPMYQNKIEGDLGSIKYTLTNTTTIGFKKCSVKSANLDLEKLQFDVNFYCPEFHVKGTYDINGLLIAMPVEGNGDYTIDSKAYDMKILMDVSLIPEGDKRHLHINNFNTYSTIIESMVFDLKNLFNGQKELADNVLKFVNENWKAVANLLQGPTVSANLKKVVKAINKFLKMHEIENFLLL